MHPLAVTVALFAIGGAFAACSPDGSQFFGDPTDAGAQGGAGGQGGGIAPSGSGASSSADSSASATSSQASVSASASASVASSSSGSTCPNGTCDAGETNATCPQDCPPGECSHGVCEPGEALVVGCDPCVDAVCDQDEFCCETSWDEQCVGEANQLCNDMCCGDAQCIGENCESCAQDCGGACQCGDGSCVGESCQSCPSDCGACPPGPTCPHTVCFPGEALSGEECHATCIADVCAQDQSCCAGAGNSWDTSCEQLAENLCGGPHPCIVAVCQQMPSCCADGGSGAGGGGGGPVVPAWTQECVNLAITTCGTTCVCDHSVCQDGQPLVVGCNPCVDAVCEADPYCCDASWDGACVGEAMSICGIDCQ